MAKNIYISIDDDIEKVIRRVKRESSDDLNLVLPKQALLFSEFVDLGALKAQLDGLGKHVAIITMDPRGKERAATAGFELRDFEALKKGGPSMDVAPRHNRSAAAGMRPIRAAARPLSTPAQPPQFREPVQRRAPVVQPSKRPQHVPDARRVEPAHHAPDLEAFSGHGAAAPRLLRPDAAEQLHQPVRKKRRPILTGFKLLSIIGVIVLVLLATVILPSAQITIYAHTQPIVRDLPIIVDRGATQMNVQQLTLPGQLIDADQSFSKQFNSTGQINVGNPARGTVQLYNFTKQTYKLGAKTTTLTVGNQTYHLANDVAGLKPTEYFSGTKDVNPASLIPEVSIVADLPGENGNLPASTGFEIHNQVLGSLPQILFAKNTQPLSGGTSRFRTVVSADDLASAQKSMQGDVLIATRQQYADKGLTLLDSGSTVQIKSATFDKKAGDDSLNFNGTVTGHVTALAYNTSDLKNLVEQRIGLTLDPNQYLVTDQSEKITETYKSADLLQGSGTLAVHFESLVAAKIDTAGIASQINGKSALELKEMLLSDPNVEGVDIVFKPFWVKSVPRFSGKVYVTSKLQQ